MRYIGLEFEKFIQSEFKRISWYVVKLDLDVNRIEQCLCTHEYTLLTYLICLLNRVSYFCIKWYFSMVSVFTLPLICGVAEDRWPPTTHWTRQHNFVFYPPLLNTVHTEYRQLRTNINDDVDHDGSDVDHDGDDVDQVIAVFPFARRRKLSFTPSYLNPESLSHNSE